MEPPECLIYRYPKLPNNLGCTDIQVISKEDMLLVHAFKIEVTSLLVRYRGELHLFHKYTNRWLEPIPMRQLGNRAPILLGFVDYRSFMVVHEEIDRQDEKQRYALLAKWKFAYHHRSVKLESCVSLQKFPPLLDDDYPQPQLFPVYRRDEPWVLLIRLPQKTLNVCIVHDSEVLDKPMKIDINDADRVHAALHEDTLLLVYKNHPGYDFYTFDVKKKTREEAVLYKYPLGIIPGVHPVDYDLSHSEIASCGRWLLAFYSNFTLLFDIKSIREPPHCLRDSTFLWLPFTIGHPVKCLSYVQPNNELLLYRHTVEGEMEYVQMQSVTVFPLSLEDLALRAVHKCVREDVRRKLKYWNIKIPFDLAQSLREPM